MARQTKHAPGKQTASAVALVPESSKFVSSDTACNNEGYCELSAPFAGEHNSESAEMDAKKRKLGKETC